MGIKFNQLGLSESILEVLVELGFEKPTDIQAEAIPQLLSGQKDFIGLAQTGTGKTAAFGLPLIDRIDTNSRCTQALVLAPTRELGQQIAKQLKIFAGNIPHLKVLPVYGGEPIHKQISALKKVPQIIIATPGRLIDLLKRKAVKLENVEYVVLDEADEMLNMGFIEDINKILSYTPDDKLTWLFSATMPRGVRTIVNEYMDDPVEVRIDVKNKVNVDIEHLYTIVKRSDKPEALMRFINVTPSMRSVVFCRTKRDTQELAEILLKKKYKADALHGDLSQKQRDRVMGRFRENDLQVLVATDVAARGIDVSDLTHVFHFLLPDDDAYYTHRSGRTARAGKKGKSIAFISSRDMHKIKRLERALNINFRTLQVPKATDVQQIRIENWSKQILDVQFDHPIEPKIIKKVNEIFEDLSKEQLIKKLIASELAAVQGDSTKDINQERDSRGDRDRGGRGDRRGRKDYGRGRKGGGGGRKGGKSGGGKGSFKKKDRDDRKGKGKKSGKPSKWSKKK